MTVHGETVECIAVGDHIYDIRQITGGVTTCRRTDTNSCPAGTNIWVPRSYDHAKAVNDIYGLTWTGVVGIYRSANGCGSCTSWAMNSDAMDTYTAGNSNGNIGWTSIAEDDGSWFVRATSTSEPNGDYTANCWLGITAAGYSTGNSSDIGFNDGYCSYSTSRYICSTNDKP